MTSKDLAEFAYGWITHALLCRRDEEERSGSHAFDIVLADEAELVGGLVASGAISMEAASIAFLKAAQTTGFVAKLGIPAVTRLTVCGIRIGLERPCDFWGFCDV
jgi:hypothetical protein